MRPSTEPASKISWVAGLALGIVALVAASMVPDNSPLLARTAGIAVVFLVVAALGAAFLKGHRVPTLAALIATPMTVFLLSSVLFAGNVVAFARHDIPILAGVIAGAFFGANLGTRFMRETGSAA